jgi:YidC/Oxa1 family membrane protein insertase
MEVTFSNKGGRVEKILLKNYTTYDKDPLVLFDNESALIDETFASKGNNISTSDLYFTPSITRGQSVDEGDSITITYTAKTTSGGTLKKIYTLYGSGYQVPYEIRTERLDNIVDNTNFKINWSDNIKKLERNLDDTRNTSTIKYFLVNDDDVDYLSETSKDIEEESFAEPLKWVSIKRKFFLSAIIAEKQFSAGSVKTIVPADTNSVKNAEVMLEIPIGDIKTNTAKFKYYFGPNDYNIIDEVTPGFWKNVSLGWGIFGLVNKYIIIPIFNILDKYLNNYGLIIVLLVLFMKLLLSPLTYKSHMSMAKMKALKPDLDLIKEKHGDDMQKAQTEQMALYQKVGINPLSGCIPMVLQMPILLAMFYFFPNAIQLRQQSFLWANDLSSYDSILNLPFTIPFYGDHVSLFTLLMTASTIILTYSNSQVQTVSGPMKSIQYVMPVMFLFFLNSYAAGLTFYYFVSNIASFSQIALFRKFVDDTKIRQKLEENRIKNANKKKSSFQTRLEEAMKTSQQTQKDKNKKKKD